MEILRFIAGGVAIILVVAFFGFLQDFFGDRQVRADLKLLWKEWRNDDE